MKVETKYARYKISCVNPSESLISFWIDQFRSLTEEQKEYWKNKLNK